MPIESHSLAKELPEYKEEIHLLKTSDNHFKKLFDEYHYLDREIEQIEKEIVLASTMEEEEFKKRRLLLKDTLFHYLQKSQNQRLAESA
ncbi:YdcH family protein [Marinomonas mediterranea]|jgi:Uncharacterized protein conserved in bacteria|uniref:GTP-binding protein n=1 Tax=Marinomonas mediterranea (strain ATCC 700492 / JCM 21426 / NBRC 103028 / MMB-1) TaxID=717774 RepID=F2JX97_MARM1|nr:DUF465 domain-containing protein [Marinomonas mediterranea]ADZ90703.1 hypothetical protein Marme_1436 [Marinomonas mediterranea MMB-1]WCN08751.1 DUF465 domain-containing protein [Marinomonas mediterranea]WCN12796.1 DUF465 domain-containing protein [Marinomonas mediterranea]WCN16866.1 DUF465 domain-containing protein [Marinomonas mediterranea MMB-1]